MFGKEYVGSQYWDLHVKSDMVIASASRASERPQHR